MGRESEGPRATETARRVVSERHSFASVKYNAHCSQLEIALDAVRSTLGFAGTDKGKKTTARTAGTEMRDGFEAR